MKVVVQHQATLHYLNAEKNWASHIQEAVVFEDFIAAMKYCAAERLTGVQVLIKFDDDAADLTMYPPRVKYPARPYL